MTLLLAASVQNMWSFKTIWSLRETVQNYDFLDSNFVTITLNMPLKR